MKKIERNIKKHLLFLCFKYNIGLLWGVSSAGLERLPVTQKVEGSSPLHPARDFYRHHMAVFQSSGPIV